ncbi:phage tail protein [Bacillus sp. ISL-47]|uniref:phage tail spike protein n=1 Tax=Bacillus sp. ISL-47 TaxID=2819130 RepID=UPI001BECA55B|nr:phage tail spike protein [Bacillus sp. ISL-47]MBT2688254.1 phage tail protein [Bacillus sp. ISL-47]MBT2710047.1 phage tail protein [Pseudomonas sp. ISL-84]
MIFVLDNAENVVATLNNEVPDACPYFNDNMTERLNDGYLAYEFEVPAEHNDAAYLLEDGYLIRKGLDDHLLLFQISRVDEYRDDQGLKKYIYAEYGWEELNKTIIRPSSFLGRTAEGAMNDALLDTRWDVGIVEWFGTKDFSFDNHITSLGFLHEIKDVFGGELRFRVEMHNGKVSGRFADLLIKRGEDAGKTFTYEKDLVGVRRIADRSTVFTALIGVGKGNETGVTLNFSNELRSKASGDAFDKPVGQAWVGDPEALQRWGHRDKNGNLKHLFGTFEYDTDQPGVLLDKTWEKLQHIKNGLMNYEVLVALLENVEGYEHEKVRIGDTVLVQDLSLKPALMLEARVLEMTRSFTDPENDKVVLGQFLPAVSNADENIKILQSVLLKKEKEWERVPAANEIVYTDGKTVESLKPAQAGADVTGDNTAKNTENVGSTPAATIEQNANNAVQKGVSYTNGWNFDADNGVTITRSDGLVRVVESATDGIKIQRRNDVSSPWQDVFFVDILGKLQIAGDLVGGSSIDVLTDVKVGQNIYLQFAYEDRFNKKGVIFYDGVTHGGMSTQITGTYLGMDIESNQIRVKGNILDILSGLTRFWDGTDVYFNGNQPISSHVETGFCGCGGMAANTTTSAVAGQGVNFKMKKSYTPSSVALTVSSSNRPANVIDINPNGFWIYVNGNGVDGGYYYWRGTYTA